MKLSCKASDVAQAVIVNQTQLMDRLRALTGEEREDVLRMAIDVAGRGIGARLPNDVVRELGRDLPPLLAEPLMAGSGRSPPHPGTLYAQLSAGSGVSDELALTLVQSVLALVGEAAEGEHLDRARAALPTDWGDLLRPIGA